MSGTEIDPRIRLLDDVGAGSAMLKRLDGIPIIIRTDPQHADLAVALCNIIGRTTPNVRIQTQRDAVVQLPFFGTGTLATHAQKLISENAVTNELGASPLIVAAGSTCGGADIYVSTDGWNVRLTPDPHDPLKGHGPGIAAASALAAAEVFKRAVGEVPGMALPKDGLEWNLVDYRLDATASRPANNNIEAVCFGAGSVGSSLVYALILAGVRGNIVVVDPDELEPHNRMRYPAWVGDFKGLKTDWISSFRAGELCIETHPSDAVTYIYDHEDPIPIAIAAVDNVDARRDIATALARTTLNAGVDGLQLHVSRHSFGDGLACVYCPYVDTGPALAPHEVWSEITGLASDRVQELLRGAPLEQRDVDEMSGPNAQDKSDEDLVGRTLNEVRERLYAEVLVETDGERMAVSAPFVSGLAGAVLASELIKEVAGSEQRVDRRVDLDLAGVPTGLTRRLSQDGTGRCLCHDPFYLSRYREMWEIEADGETRR